MLLVENIETYGFEAAIRGMRQPMLSHDLMDSKWIDTPDGPFYLIGPNDEKLMRRLAKAGNDHRKYLRMITVTMDITAPLYWWKEFDQYKVGTVTNSTSTMHKIHAKEFGLSDFSYEHLLSYSSNFTRDDETDRIKQVKVNDDISLDGYITNYAPLDILEQWIIPSLNKCRERYIETKDKKYWWQMIQLLPSSYMQKRTVCLNFEALANMYHARKGHKLNEWEQFRVNIDTRIPYADIITDLGRRKREK